MNRLLYLFFYMLPGVFFWLSAQWLLGVDLLSRIGQVIFIGMVLLQYRLSQPERRGSALLHGLGIYLYAIFLLPPAFPGLVLWTLLSLFLFLPGSLFIGYPYRHPLLLLLLLGGVAGTVGGLTSPQSFWFFAEKAPFELMPYLALFPAAYMVWKEPGHLLEMLGLLFGLAALLFVSGQSDALRSILTGPFVALLVVYFGVPFRSRYPGYLQPVLVGGLFFFLFFPSLYVSFWFHSDESAILWPSAAVFVLQDWLSAPLQRYLKRALL